MDDPGFPHSRSESPDHRTRLASVRDPPGDEPGLATAIKAATRFYRRWQGPIGATSCPSCSGDALTQAAREISILRIQEQRGRVAGQTRSMDRMLLPATHQTLR